MDHIVIDNDFLRAIAGLGVGGMLAGVIFLMYRKDVKSYTELWKNATTMLIDALNKSTAAHVENTASNREMSSLLRALHRRLDRVEATEGGHAEPLLRRRREE
jgi:hypothetical protein